MHRFIIAAIVAVAFLFGFNVESFAKESPAPGVKTVAAKRTMKKKRTRKYRRHVRKNVRYGKRAVKKVNTPAKVAKAAPARRATSDFKASTVSTFRPVSATVAFEFAGLVAQPDGSNAKLWHSREFTTDTRYAYVGKMKFGPEWVHVWMESEAPAETLVASVTEPAVEEGTETFPDGGAGIVEVAADDPLAMAREQEEIIRTTPEEVLGVPEGSLVPMNNGKPTINVLPAEAPITNPVADPNLKPIQPKK
jgi:hypothetical protein